MQMTTPPPTRIAKDLANRKLIVQRTFFGPIDLVWRAWTDPQQIDHWWGPTGFRNETLTIAIRPGGVWRYIMHDPDGTDYDNRTIYREVVAPERLVYRHGRDMDDDPDAFDVTVTFEAQGNQTKLTMRIRFATAEQYAANLAFGAVEGGNQTLTRLAEYLPQLA